MKEENKQAVKSMTQLGLYLILMIVMWVFIAKLVFPDSGKPDAYQTFINDHAPLMEQVAQNAMDADLWPAIQDTSEVQDMLKEGGIVSVTGDETGASFWMQDENPDVTLRYVYCPEGKYTLPDEVLNMRWEGEKGDTPDALHFVCVDGEAAGQGSITAKRLSDKFFLESRLIP